MALDTGDYSCAADTFERALRSIPQTSHEDLLDRAFAANGLGVAYSRLGRYSRAEKSLRTALSISRDVLGPTAPLVAIVLNNLATTRLYVGSLSDARRYYSEALSIDENVFGSRSSIVANDLNNLASVDLEERKYTHAQQLLERAILIGTTLVPQDSRVPLFMRNLAAMFSRLHRFHEAKDLYDKILETQEVEQGPAHPNVGITLSERAYAEIGLKQCQAAIVHAKTSLEILRASIGEEHPRTATAYWTLGTAYACDKRPDLAEPALHRAVEIEQHIEKPTDVRCSHIRSYARVLRALRRTAEAKKFDGLADSILRERTKRPSNSVDVKELQADARR